MTTPATEIDARFSDKGAAATEWEETKRVLETAELFWICTVRSDGRPHMTPLVAVWLDGTLYFCTGETEQKFLNMRTNPNVLLIDVTGGGNVTFSPTGGLTGANTWMILDIGTGTASGNIFVQNLDINRAGATGSTSLSGTVNGVGGLAAAAAAGIQPGPNSSFRFNSCPIQSVNCILVPTLKPPAANPLNDFSIGSFYNSNDQDDLLLPIVSDQDY